jgi:hypothetical protein
VGVSPESDKIEELLMEYRKKGRESASYAWRDALVQDVFETFRTCAVAGWDGYDAEPVSLHSANGIIELLKNLPEGIEPPVVVPEPNGDIALEWQTGEHRRFSVSVTGPTFVYAGIFGGSTRQYGEERFFGAIPRTILEILVRNFPAG